MPERKHLRRLDEVYKRDLPPVFFITLCTYERKRILDSDDMALEIIDTFKQSEHRHGWLVGRYVVMPDHLHFFAAPGNMSKDLSGFIRAFKRHTANRAKEMQVVAA